MVPATKTKIQKDHPNDTRHKTRKETYKKLQSATGIIATLGKDGSKKSYRKMSVVNQFNLTEKYYRNLTIT